MAEPNRVIIPYAPRRQFMPFHQRTKRWAVIVAHRRAGKTVACINDIIKHAVLCDKPDGRYAYVAPLFNQAKDVAWSYLKRYSQPILSGEPNESELRVDLINGARIRLYGADNPDRLRGLYLDGVILDEYADMRPSVWGEIIRPMLADRKGWATFIGTPKGRNEFFDKWDQAENDPNWFRSILRASETGILDSIELTDAKASMTPEQYEQEFECSFDAAILGAYFGKEMAEAQRKGRITDVPIDPSLPVNTAWDLGNGDHMAIWCWQAAGAEIRVVDFLQSHGYSMEKYCSDLDERGYHGTDYVPHDARVKSLETGKTRIETLVAMKRKPKLVASHYVEDGINAARVEFPRIWFDQTKCKPGLEALRQYQVDYDEKLRTFKNTPKADWASHPADAFRYLCMAYRQQFPEPVKEPPRILAVGPQNSVSLDDLYAWQPVQSGRL